MAGVTVHVVPVTLVTRNSSASMMTRNWVAAAVVTAGNGVEDATVRDVAPAAIPAAKVVWALLANRSVATGYTQRLVTWMSSRVTTFSLSPDERVKAYGSTTTWCRRVP